jgi:hypothetical protein
MTVFIMHCCKKTNALAIVLSCLSFCLMVYAWAAENSLNIKMAELVPVEESYLLNADFDITFNEEAEAALNKGVPFHFLIEFQLISPVRYWFDDEIVLTSTEATIRYHALSRQYLINRGKHQLSFHSLQEAKEELSHLRGWHVFDKSLLVKGEAYHAALRMRLDQSKLPKPMQVDALSSEAWSMVSERHRWVPELVY